MSLQEILYGVLIVSVVVITVTLVWVANDLKGLLRSLRHSAEDTEKVTHEIKQKVLMLGEALDRAGAAAASVIGLIESGIDQIKEKRDSIAAGIGLITGAGRAIKNRRSQEDEEEKEEKDEKKEEIFDIAAEKVENEEEQGDEKKDEKDEKKEKEAPTIRRPADVEVPTEDPKGSPGDVGKETKKEQPEKSKDKMPPKKKDEPKQLVDTVTKA